MRPLRFVNPLFIGLAVLCTACDSPSASNGGASIEWLEDNAVPFATVDPGGSFTDLAPLGQMIGDARIVGLGEATHGSSEFFRMKHRVLEYLVRERGFRVFGIEATWAEALRVNHYIHTGDGAPAALLSNLRFWTWHTREVLDMILWMRAYNQTVPEAERVSFYGFDIQYSRVAMDEVVTYLRQVDVAAADSVVEWYSCFRQFQDKPNGATPNYSVVADLEKQRCREGVQAAHGLLQRRADEFTPRAGRATYDLALRTARVVVQNEDLRGYPQQGTLKRDAYMAENVEWLANVGEPGKRQVLWAHNAHVSRWEPFMGVNLTQAFGDDYVVVGFSFYRGGFNAVEATSGLRPLQAGEAKGDSYEHEFHRLGHERFYVDLRPIRAAGAPSDARWLLGPRPLRMIGATYRITAPEEAYADHDLAREYDILIHLTGVTPTELLPFISN
jgi:erythromycin esterase